MGDSSSDGGAGGAGMLGGMMGGGGAGAAIGAVLGLLKAGNDVKNEVKDRELESIKERYSPWTGLKPHDVEHPNTLGDVLAGIKSGVGMQQGITQANDQHDMTQEILKRMMGGSSPPVTYNMGGSALPASLSGGAGGINLADAALLA